jgi:hypothetical protein
MYTEGSGGGGDGYETHVKTHDIPRFGTLVRR